MDKRVIFAVAGSGKTTYIIKQLNLEKRSLIITYTNNNIENLRNGIIEKFGYFPENITLLPYFSFIYSFCYRPFLSYKYKTRGINFESNPNRFIKQDQFEYYFDCNRRIYSNRISKIIEKCSVVEIVVSRIEKYFDNLLIDEIQDFAGNDFNFLKHLSNAKLDLLFVGDFFQHTYDTSRDLTSNKNLHKDITTYYKEFDDMGLTIDLATLSKSYRCSSNICKFIKDNLKINIESHREDYTNINIIEKEEEAERIYTRDNIVKFFYQEHYKYGCHSRNWGDSKGENHYHDICVVLNKKTLEFFKKLNELAPQTKNKLYVACTRARGDLYFVSDEFYEKYKKTDKGI